MVRHIQFSFWRGPKNLHICMCIYIYIFFLIVICFSANNAIGWHNLFHTATIALLAGAVIFRLQHFWTINLIFLELPTKKFMDDKSERISTTLIRRCPKTNVRTQIKAVLKIIRTQCAHDIDLPSMLCYFDICPTNGVNKTFHSIQWRGHTIHSHFVWFQMSRLNSRLKLLASARDECSELNKKKRNKNENIN